MKKVLLSVCIFSFLYLSFPSNVLAYDTYVHGYYRKNGTYVQPHYRSNADGNPYNNYSTIGNYNPYTGQPGYVNPYNYNYSGTNYNYYYQPQTSNDYEDE